MDMESGTSPVHRAVTRLSDPQAGHLQTVLQSLQRSLGSLSTPSQNSQSFICPISSPHKIPLEEKGLIAFKIF